MRSSTVLTAGSFPSLSTQDSALTAGGSPAAMYFIHADHLNSPRLITNQAGQAVWRWDQSDPFGGNVANENPSGLGTFTCNLRLPGQYFDKETNLHYNYFRDYDAGIGRYVQSDPIGLHGGINTYAYVNGSPIRYADPHGLDYQDYQERSDAVRAVGPYDAYRGGYRFAGMAERTARRSGLPGPQNGPQDAYRHCVWSCLMTRSIGASGATTIGNIHEAANRRAGQPFAEEQMDQHNNVKGRYCGTRPGNCEQLCLDLLDLGGLGGLGGITLRYRPPVSTPFADFQ
jgi:RHS repeat-associated protein